MYKKSTALFCILLTMMQYASDITPWLEIKPGYFFFSTSPMNDIYDKGGFEIQGSLSVPICKYLDLYGSIGCRHVRGNALSTCEKTRLTVIPFDIGLKPIFNFYECFYYFFAVGPRFFYFHQRNNSSYVDHIINGGGAGLFVNTGFNVLFADCFLLGIFGEYSYEKKKIYPKMPGVFSNGGVQISGFAFGLSFGYAF